MKPTLYIVDEDQDAASLLRQHLLTAGYGVRVFTSPAKALSEAEQATPGLFLIGLGSASLAGDTLELCRTIRARSALVTVPIILLSASSNEVERIAGLDAGADDFMQKHSSPRELLARIKAVLRRFEPELSPEPLRLGVLTIDSAAMLLSVAGRNVPLTVVEFRLVEFLARHAGRVFSRHQLVQSVWRESHAITPRSVDVYIRRVREKIEPNPGNPQFLKTIRGAGYRLEAPR